MGVVPPCERSIGGANGFSDPLVPPWGRPEGRPGRFWRSLDLDGVEGLADGHGVEYLGLEERREARGAEPLADADLARQHEVSEAAVRADVPAEGDVARNGSGPHCPSASR